MLLITDRNPDNLLRVAEYIRQKNVAPLGTCLERQTFPLEVLDAHRDLAVNQTFFFKQVDEFIKDPYIPELLIALSAVYPSEITAMQSLLEKAQAAAMNKEVQVKTIWFYLMTGDGSFPAINVPEEIKISPNTYFDKVSDISWQKQHSAILQQIEDGLLLQSFSDTEKSEELRTLVLNLIRCEVL